MKIYIILITGVLNASETVLYRETKIPATIISTKLKKKNWLHWLKYFIWKGIPRMFKPSSMPFFRYVFKKIYNVN